MKLYTPLLIAGLLSVIGLIALFSLALADRSAQDAFNPWQQLLAVMSGLVVALIVARLNLADVKRFAGWFYLVSLMLLTAVLLWGETVNGATRWLGIGNFSFQPAEFARLGVIVLLARLLSSRQAERRPAFTLVRTAIYGLAPAVLVALQPDLGSAVVFAIIWLIMLACSALPRRMVALTGLILAASAVASLPLLADYQRSRIESFLNPLADSSGAGYNARQSLIAVGSGQLTGRGLDAGSQSNLRFLPAEHTDFIFAVIAEKLGFIGAGLTLVCLATLSLVILIRAGRAASSFAGYVLTGIGAMIAIPAVVNVGMNLGWLPVTGIPLPFASYGGSHVLSGFIAIGLVLAAGRSASALSFSVR
jgi:rod shape determining protein RodA